MMIAWQVRQKVGAERKAVETLRAELERDKEAFQGDVGPQALPTRATPHPPFYRC